MLKSSDRQAEGERQRAAAAVKHDFYLSLSLSRSRPSAGRRRTGLFGLRVVSDAYQRDRELRGSLAAPAPSLMTALGTRMRQQRLKIAAQPAATAVWANNRRGRSFSLAALRANTFFYRRMKKKKKYNFGIGSNWLFSLCDRAACPHFFAGRLTDSDGI